MTYLSKVLKPTDVLLNYLNKAVMVGSLHNLEYCYNYRKCNIKFPNQNVLTVVCFLTQKGCFNTCFNISKGCFIICYDFCKSFPPQLSTFVFSLEFCWLQYHIEGGMGKKIDMIHLCFLFVYRTNVILTVGVFFLFFFKHVMLY